MCPLPWRARAPLVGRPGAPLGLPCAGNAAGSHVPRRYPTGQSCAFVFTIAHDAARIARKAPKSERKEFEIRKDFRNSFCALLIKIAQKELRQRSGYFGEN